MSQSGNETMDFNRVDFHGSEVNLTSHGIPEKGLAEELKEKLDVWIPAAVKISENHEARLCSVEEQLKTLLGEDLTFFVEVEREREKQRRKWGNDHDDEKTSNDWSWLLTKYVNKFGARNTTGKNKEVAIQIAALAYALYEALERQAE